MWHMVERGKKSSYNNQTVKQTIKTRLAGCNKLKLVMTTVR